MDNFRRPKRSYKHAPIDGIIKPRQSRSAPLGSIDFRRQFEGAGGAKRLDDFRRPDGFHQAAQPVIALDRPLPPLHSGPRSRTKLHLPDAPPHRGLKKTHTVRRRVLKYSGILLLILLITGGYLFGKGYLNARKIFKGNAAGAAALEENVDPSKLKGEGDGRVNILILGKGGPGHDGPDLTDTMLVASIDPVNKEAALLSIPRDLWVRAPNDGSTKINAVYALAKERVLSSGRDSAALSQRAEQAGLDSVQQVVSSTMGIPIHYHVMIDFEGFRKAIDTVGGVDINVKQRVYDPTMAWENYEHNKTPLIADVGQQHFDGYQALMYSRSRHGSPRGDFDRAERQREVIVALKNKVMSVGTFANPVKISQLSDAFGNHIQTDLSLNDMTRLYSLTKQIPSSKVSSVGLADPPNDFVTTGDINGVSVVKPKAGLFDYSDIQNYVRNTLKDGYIKKENANIMVLNGTSFAGLATKQANQLKSYGYNVGQVGDAPTKTYQQTVLVAFRDGAKKYTQHYLEQRLHVSAVSKLPDSSISSGSADFVIILGANAAYNN